MKEGALIRISVSSLLYLQAIDLDSRVSLFGKESTL